MAGVITQESAPAYAAVTPRYGIAARKYATEFIGAFFLTFAVGMAALTGSVFVPLAAGFDKFTAYTVDDRLPERLRLPGRHPIRLPATW